MLCSLGGGELGAASPCTPSWHGAGMRWSGLLRALPAGASPTRAGVGPPHLISPTLSPSGGGTQGCPLLPACRTWGWVGLGVGAGGEGLAGP